MKLSQRIRNAFTGFNTDGAIPIQTIPAGGLLRDSRSNPMYSEWTHSVVSPRDMYTGYPYAAINNRANAVAELAINNLRTDAVDSIEQVAARENRKVVHPYLDLIDSSPSFTNYHFWYSISAYLDLTGVAYILVVRNTGELRGTFTVGAIQEIELLNPYRIKPVINQSTKELEGFEENLGEGRTNALPLEMVIPIRKFNPFSTVEPLAPMDAAKDAQFTMKTSSDHTRVSIQRNINAPGMITTAAELNGEELENFKARVYEHKKGKPLIGVGSAKALQWQDMQIDLDKAALTQINQLNLDAIIAVTGNSRTTFGIEQSGVTRDTAKVQSDLFIGNHVIPQLRIIIDSFNQDYRNSYIEEFDRTGYFITIDSPLKTDLDSDARRQDLRDREFNLYDRMIQSGYNAELAAQYVDGELDLSELGKPIRPQIPLQIEEDDNDGEDETRTQKMLNKATQQQSVTLQSAVVRVDQQLLGYAQTNLPKALNALKQTDLVKKSQKNQVNKDLKLVLVAYYTTLMNSLGPQFTSERMAEFGMFAAYNFDTQAKKFINQTAELVADSHIDTVLEDMMRVAQQGALDGKGVDEITRDLQTKFNEQISQSRAELVADTESNRAFNMSQYDADRQFILENNLEGKAFVEWRTTSPKPCPICESLDGQVVPYGEPFVAEGETITADVKLDNGDIKTISQTAWTDTFAGNIHARCNCEYSLIIE